MCLGMGGISVSLLVTHTYIISLLQPCCRRYVFIIELTNGTRSRFLSHREKKEMERENLQRDTNSLRKRNWASWFEIKIDTVPTICN